MGGGSEMFKNLSTWFMNEPQPILSCKGISLLLPFQLICTGTFYEEWIDEDKRFPLPIYLNMICIVLHFTMIFLIFKSGRKVKLKTGPANQKFQKNATAINFGSIPISWLIFLLCASGLILGQKMYRYFIYLVILHKSKLQF